MLINKKVATRLSFHMVISACSWNILRNSSVYSSKWKPTARAMSIFVQKLNVLTGKTEWEVQDEHYDFHQEIAASAFADMLHDTDRNQKYYQALKKAIEIKHSKGEKANVLDIGTGTGLLSMMAATCKADSIVACEAFSPIAAVAREVIDKNGFSNQIKVVGKRSTELKVGPGQDLESRANILVTEVFDTELIGEGAVLTFNHAHKELLTSDAIVVPAFARVFAILLESPELHCHNVIRESFPVKNSSIKIADKFLKCAGSSSLFDIQASQLTNFNSLSTPIEVFHVDFSGSPIPNEEFSIRTVKASKSGTAHCLLMWWELAMDKNEEIIVSCAPEWLENRHQAWRDHWMQAVYFFSKPLPLQSDQSYELISNHDEFSLWFDLFPRVTSEKPNKLLPSPICECGLHSITSRARLGSMNDLSAWKLYLSSIESFVTEDSVVFFIGDLSLLPLAISLLNVKHVYCVEEHYVAFDVMNNLIKENNLEDRITLLSSYNNIQTDNKVTHIIGEPFFRASIFSWENLRFWYLAKRLFSDAQILPDQMTIMAVPVQFEHLQKIRAPLGVVENFDMTPFDRLIECSNNAVEPDMEVHPLWEYPSVALGPPQRIMTFNLTKDIPEESIQCDGLLEISSQGTCNGVAFWIECDFGSTSFSYGLQSPVKPGSKPDWYRFSKQPVQILKHPVNLFKSDNLKFHADFNTNVGSFHCNLSFKGKHIK